MSGLERLLRPGSLTVVGGGPWCEAVIAQCRRMGFQGDIWPIHPYKSALAGVPAFAALDDLPGVPDAAFIGVNRQATIAQVARLRAMGAGGAVCFASGFKETKDGLALHNQLLAAADGFPILGPNCYGLLNALDRVALWPDQHGVKPVSSGVAIVAQSSNMAINMTMQRRGLPIAYVVTAGNQMQQGVAEIGRALIADERVTALGIYVEGFDDIRAYEQLAQDAARLSKPIVALKAGQSEEARAATLSHTASLAGSTAGASALMVRLGLAQVSSLGVFLEALKIAHVHGNLRASRIASLSCSGGEASVMADTARAHGLTFPPLGEAQKEKLAEHLSAMVHLSNPLDYHTDIWRDRDAMTQVFSVVCGGQIDLTLIVLDFPRQDICDDTDWIITVEAIETAASRTGRPYGVVASLPENMPEAMAERLMAGGIVALCDLEQTCAAIAALANTSPVSMDLTPILRATTFEPSAVPVWALSEHAAKAALKMFGLSVPRGMRAEGAKATAEASHVIGFPVVLKGEGFAHKSDSAAVIVGLEDPHDVEVAANKMAAETFLVERMIENIVCELLVGAVHDPAHGFVLTLAAGGVMTELLEDRQSLLVPTSRKAIESALSRLKVKALIDGYRGQAGANRQAIVSAIMDLQAYVIANAEDLVEVEVNPLICTETHAIAADALIIKRDHQKV